VTINVTVLSTVGPRGVAFRKPRDARAIQVNVPYHDGFEVVLRDPEGNPTFAESDIDVTLALDEQVPGPTGLTGTLTRTIIAGRSSVVFADLVFDRDGRFTLLASPIVDLSSATSEPFTVTYRPPEIAIDDITINDGCVDIAYTITQPDGAPVDVLVEYSESESTSIATQAASNTGTQGHYHLASDDGLLKHWRWNASHDLGLANVAVQLTVRARAGSRIIDNPWGRDEGDVTIEIAEGRPCQPEVSALLATPPWPDPTPPTDNDLLYGTDTLAAADMNGDGKLDLLSLAPAGVRISYGRGDGGFELASQVLSPMNPDGATLALATGDFNGDGRTDVALGSGAGGIEVWRQDDVAGDFTFTTSLVAAEGARMTAGDLDGNDSDDLVFIDDEGNITVAYFDEGDFETVAVTPEPLAIDLEVMDADGHAGLDIVYYRFQIVLNDGMFLEHEICVIRTGAFPGGSDRTFSDPDCRFVGEGFDFRVADLTPDPDSLAGGRVFFRSGYPWSQEVRTLTYSDGGFSSPEYVYNACDFATPEGFAIGLFESWDAFRDDPTSDLATSCDYHGASASLDFLVRNFDDNVTDSAYGIDFDSNTTLIAADFTGDGADDVASARGVLATRPRYMFDDYTGVRAPLYENAGSYDEENATVAGDFTNNGIPDFVTAVIEYDGNVTLQLRLDSIYPYHQYNTYTFDVCTAGCPASDSFVVQLARGDLNRDRVDDLIVTTGGDAASGRVYAFTRVGDAWQPFAELPPVLGFVPATLAVGDLLGDGDGRDDIAVAGYDGSGSPTLKVFHWVGNGYDVYVEAATNILPNPMRESFIGELDPDHSGPELVIVGAGSLYVSATLATSGCGALTPTCIDATNAPFPLIGLDNYTLDGVAMADLEGDGEFELVSQARFLEGANALQEVLVTRLTQGGGNDVTTLAQRRFADLGLCDIGETVACLEPGVGPLVGDLDREGTQDVVVGWNGGRTWEAITAKRRYLFGGTVSERASHALLTDIDDNRLLDVLVLEQGEGSDLWMLGQELYPNESPNF